MTKTFTSAGEKLDKVSGWLIVVLFSLVLTLVGAWATNKESEVNDLDKRTTKLEQQVARDVAEIKGKLDILIEKTK